MSDWVHGIFNASKCARYLRSIGIELLPTEVRRWREQELMHRADRRRVRRREAFECGQCRARWEVESRRRSKKNQCPHCGGRPTQMWLLWMELGSGERRKYDAAAWGYDGECGPQNVTKTWPK